MAEDQTREEVKVRLFKLPYSKDALRRNSPVSKRFGLVSVMKSSHNPEETLLEANAALKLAARELGANEVRDVDYKTEMIVSGRTGTAGHMTYSVLAYGNAYRVPQ